MLKKNMEVYVILLIVHYTVWMMLTKEMSYKNKQVECIGTSNTMGRVWKQVSNHNMEVWVMKIETVDTVACLGRIVLNKWLINNNILIFKGMEVLID